VICQSLFFTFFLPFFLSSFLPFFLSLHLRDVPSAGVVLLYGVGAVAAT
jgi:hypothetical protein